MKTAIYIEDGVVQLVLTPENDFEKNALRAFESERVMAKVFTGSFYDCRGGWTRQADFHVNHFSARDDRSLILRMEPETKAIDGAAP